jgi:uncharacterized membrane protein YbhN (UPF0104 family)
MWMMSMIKWLKKNNQTIIRTLGSIVAIILLFFFLKEEEQAEILSALKNISLWYFVVAMFVLFISRFFTILRWHILLKSAGLEISFSRSSMLTFTGLFTSNFLPTTIGGDVVRLAGAIQLGYDRAICLASLVADRLIGLIGMLFTLPFGLIPVLSFKASTLQSITIASLYHQGTDFIKNTGQALQLWISKPKALLSSLLATFGNMLFIFLAMYVLILGIDRFVSYWLVAGLWSLTYFVTLIPISINGFGVQELSLTFLLSQFGGLTQPESLTIAILIRALFIITSLPGAFSLPSMLTAIKEKQNV